MSLKPHSHIGSRRILVETNILIETQGVFFLYICLVNPAAGPLNLHVSLSLNRERKLMRIIGTFIVTGVNWPRAANRVFQVAKPKPASKAARGKYYFIKCVCARASEPRVCGAAHLKERKPHTHRDSEPPLFAAERCASAAAQIIIN